MGTARTALGGAGSQSAGLAFGGATSSGVFSALTEEYDGTTWSAGSNMGTARYYLAGAGSQSAGLAFGGYAGAAVSALTEEYTGPT